MIRSPIDPIFDFGKGLIGTSVIYDNEFFGIIILLLDAFQCLHYPFFMVMGNTDQGDFF
jgi:hypothetical protein